MNTIWAFFPQNQGTFSNLEKGQERPPPSLPLVARLASGFITCFTFINPFHVTDFFHVPLKTSKKSLFRGIEREQWHEMG